MGTRQLAICNNKHNSTTCSHPTFSQTISRFRYKSAEPPTQQTGVVDVVVGTTFESLVLNSGRIGLFEVYAPWCGHCKKLEPTYNDLGAHYENNDKVRIAKMDGTTNEVAEIEIKGYPSIFFFNGKGSVIAYDGARELKDFITFLDGKL